MHLSLRHTQRNPSKEIFTVGIIVFFFKDLKGTFKTKPFIGVIKVKDF